jgi:hypothetical protein
MFTFVEEGGQILQVWSWTSLDGDDALIGTYHLLYYVGTYRTFDMPCRESHPNRIGRIHDQD